MEAEYFWDEDPGTGRGVAVPVAPGETWVAAWAGGMEVEVGGLNAGMHRMGLRVKDDAGRWSEVAWSGMSVESAEVMVAGVTEWPEGHANGLLVEAEYFWDEDPGTGAGELVVLGPSETWTRNPGLAVSMEGLGVGWHQLGLRVREGTGRWSAVAWASVKVEAREGLLSGVESWSALGDDVRLVEAEYFWDSDPGHGSGFLLAIPVADSHVLRTEDIPGVDLGVPDFAIGHHRLGFRVRDGLNRWSEAVWSVFRVVGESEGPGEDGDDNLAGAGAIRTLAVGGPGGVGMPSWLAGGESLAPVGYRWGSMGVEHLSLGGISGVAGISTAAWGDVNGDGLNDLALGMSWVSGGGLRLYLNRGEGQFERLRSGAVDGLRASIRAVAWSDMDRDGRLDLVVLAEDAPAVRVFRNASGGGFEAGWEFGAEGGGRSLMVGELTGDGYADVVWVDSGGLHWRRNLGGAGYVEGVLPTMAEAEAMVGAMVFDPDNDGDMDVLVLSRTRGAELLRNSGAGLFEVAEGSGFEQAGLRVRTAAVVDLDGNGWLDVVVVSESGSASVYRNLGDGTVEWTPGGLGVEGITEVAVADVDGSGTPDLVLAGAGGGMEVVTRELPGVRWVRIEPRGVNSNRTGIGARVTVVAWVDGRRVVQTRELMGSDGFGGHDELAPVFMLGGASVVEEVRVDWPSGLSTELRDQAVDQAIVVNAPPLVASLEERTLDRLKTLLVDLSGTGVGDPGPGLTYSLASGPEGMTVSAAGKLEWSPPMTHAVGIYPVSVRVSDGMAHTTGTFRVRLMEINDVPAFAKGPDRVDWDDAGPVVVAGWATGISAGPADEAGQRLGFVVETTNAGLFAMAPAIAPNGTLTYMPRKVAKGMATVTVRLRDDGGTANGAMDTSASQAFTITVQARPRVVGRWLFYNHSRFDGNDAGLGIADDEAIATDKVALRKGAGRVSSFANISSYHRGINGVAVDIVGLAGTPTAADFGLRVGRGAALTEWTAGPGPAVIRVRAGAGLDGSDRVMLSWVDSTVRNRWLEVTVKANEQTGMVEPDTFYFGSVVGETGPAAANGVQSVTVGDVLAVRLATRLGLVPVTATHDINRDGFINTTDVMLVRANQTTSATRISPIAP